MFLLKPQECLGCPLYGSGKGFIQAEGQGSTGVLILGEAGGENEEADGLPFRGYAESGSVLNRALALAGYTREQFTLYNILGCRPPNNFLSGASYEFQAIDHCQVHLDREIGRAHV